MSKNRETRKCPNCHSTFTVSFTESDEPFLIDCPCCSWSFYVSKSKEDNELGNEQTFQSGAKRDVKKGKGRCDLLPASALLRLARHFESGASKYGDRNWEKGIPISSFIDSGMRHFLKYMSGWEDEDHLCAATWNLICAMWTEEKHPELLMEWKAITGRDSRKGS